MRVRASHNYCLIEWSHNYELVLIRAANLPKVATAQHEDVYKICDTFTELKGMGPSMYNAY